MKVFFIIIAVPLLMPVMLVVILLLQKYVKPPEKIIKNDITILSARKSLWLKTRLPIYVGLIMVFLVAFFIYILAMPSRRGGQELFYVNITFIIFIFLWLLMGYAFISTYAGIKEIGYGKDFVFISNFKNNIRVPFPDIENVWTVNKYTGGRPLLSHTIVIYVSLKSDTVFGREIYFLPYKGEMLSKGEEHSVAIELKNVIGHSGSLSRI